MRTPEEEKTFNQFLIERHKFEEENEPVYAGCPNGSYPEPYNQCFCTGACKKIISWRPRGKSSSFETLSYSPDNLNQQESPNVYQNQNHGIN